MTSGRAARCVAISSLRKFVASGEQPRERLLDQQAAHSGDPSGNLRCKLSRTAPGGGIRPAQQRRQSRLDQRDLALCPLTEGAQVARLDAVTAEGDQLAQRDEDGRALMNIVTVRDDGQDCTVLAPTANVKAN